MRQKRYELLQGKNLPRSEIYEIEPSVINKSGSQLLREQESWINSFDKIDKKQKNTLIHAAITAGFIPVVGYFSYEAWKPPKSTKKVFLEVFFNDHPIHVVARVMLAIFIFHLLSKTSFHAKEYYELSQEEKEIRKKMEVLKDLADLADTIAGKERFIESLNIESKILMQECSSP